MIGIVWCRRASVATLDHVAMDRYEYDIVSGASSLIIIGSSLIAEYGSSYLRKFLQ